MSWRSKGRWAYREAKLDVLTLQGRAQDSVAGAAEPLGAYFKGWPTRDRQPPTDEPKGPEARQRQGKTSTQLDRFEADYVSLPIRKSKPGLPEIGGRSARNPLCTVIPLRALILPSNFTFASLHDPDPYFPCLCDPPSLLGARWVWRNRVSRYRPKSEHQRQHAWTNVLHSNESHDEYSGSHGGGEPDAYDVGAVGSLKPRPHVDGAVGCDEPRA